MPPPMVFFEKEVMEDIEEEIEDLIDHFSDSQDKRWNQQINLFDEIDLAELELARSQKKYRNFE